MSDKFLDKVYSARDANETREVYDEWSASYDAEVAENAYVTPARCAAALAEFVPDKTTPILDFGCGTGLSGQALRDAGFGVVDGLDLSPKMLEQARAKGIYRNLSETTPDAAIPSTYPVIAAIGVIGAGAAPISVFDSIMYALPPKGKFLFSFNDHTLADPANTARLNEWLDCGAARLLFAEYGPHLPGRDMNSTVYLVEKM